MLFVQTTKKCLKCDAGMLEARVKRGFLVKNLLFFMPLKRFKCTACKKKSYVLVPDKPTRKKKPQD